jgi:hypothetical protein
MFSQENQYRCEGSTLTTTARAATVAQRQLGRARIDDAVARANTGYFDFPYWVTQATWTSTVSSKLLVEAGFSRFAYRHAGGPGQVPPDGLLDLIPVQSSRRSTAIRPTSPTAESAPNSITSAIPTAGALRPRTPPARTT